MTLWWLKEREMNLIVLPGFTWKKHKPAFLCNRSLSAYMNRNKEKKKKLRKDYPTTELSEFSKLSLLTSERMTFRERE